MSERVVDATRYVTRIGKFVEALGGGSKSATVNTNVPTERMLYTEGRGFEKFHI